jgi:hypothetical protein
MNPAMDKFEPQESHAASLCKSCGLCCSGHLFAWVKLRSAELDPLQSMGLDVVRVPRHRGFNQPCPLWNGQCTIYHSSVYPRACRTYKCKLLKNLLEQNTEIASALGVVQQAKTMIHELESLLPASSNCNFRERLVAFLELQNTDQEIKQKAIELLIFYRDYFEVKDLVDNLEEI